MKLNMKEAETNYGNITPKTKGTWLAIIDGTCNIFEFDGTPAQLKRTAKKICKDNDLAVPDSLTIIRFKEEC